MVPLADFRGTNPQLEGHSWLGLRTPKPHPQKVEWLQDSGRWQHQRNRPNHRNPEISTRRKTIQTTRS
jgi:hypothetical protein